jgi:GAF domain-containing protein/HAMP domain-containing protein
MNFLSITQILPLVAWFLALAEFITALYLLALNVRHTANRHVSVLCLLLAVNSFAVGQLAKAAAVADATTPAYLLAATSATVQPWLILVTVAVLRPGWLSPPGEAKRSRARRCLWLVAYFAAFLPVLLTAADAALHRRLWYTGLDAAAYSGGYVPPIEFVSGSISLPVRVASTYIAPAIAAIPMLYVALGDRKATGRARRMAWLLLVTQIAGTAFQFGQRHRVPGGLGTLTANALFAAVYTFAGSQQMIAGKPFRRGRLQLRLAALTLAISVPLLVATLAFGTDVAREMTDTYAQELLRTTNQSVKTSVTTWLATSRRGLERLVTLPGITSMDPALQEPILEAAAAAQPYLYLISTTDLNGISLARSDGAGPQDYGDCRWFQEVKQGAPIAIQSLVDSSWGKPALVISVPIRDPDSQIIGVGMLAITLGELTQLVDLARFGETGSAYVVDVDNSTITHPDPAISDSEELVDLSDSPPVAALRAGNPGLVSFTEDQRRWLAFVDEADHGWGVVVQQQESELYGGLTRFRRIAAALMVSGALALCVLTWFTVRRALLPIHSLTEAVSSISAGDLTRTLPIESEDEIGALARSFNNMSGQLRDLVTRLEEHVYTRTIELERRTRYLEATAQVARESTSVLEPRELLGRVAILIGERFGFYHTGIFLLDESREWAVLQATSSEGGRRMLAKGHRIGVGGVGIVGHVTAQGEPRVADDTGEDAAFFENPDLPQTRSELALPLRARGEVIGALDVQSTEAAAFTDQDVEVLQILADQVAMAVSNARLFQQTQTALEDERRVYGELRREAWQHEFQTQTKLNYFCDERGVRLADGPDSKPVATGLPELTLPVSLGDQILGSIQVHKDQADEWTAEEIALLGTLADQLGLALENARLFGDSQRRAAREQLISQAASRLRGSLDIDTVLQTAVREIGEALGLAEVQVRLRGDSQREGVPLQQGD